uniref:Nebulin n=1 Tax=Phallusia mammillata TaxID=59560 RepID=A0A6F9DLF8_9ASCI|nr:nebulin [Phallusia mammillata]
MASDDEQLQQQVVDDMSQDKWKGKPTAYMTPQMMHALKMSQVQSQVDYQRAMKDIKGKYNLDACLPLLPEVENAKRVSKNTSKNEYRKGLEDVKERFTGFQRLRASDYLDVQRSLKAAELSDSRYKEDWEYDKGIVCFPATLTPGYDTLVSAQRNASDNAYKEGLESTLENVHFDPTKTDLYKCIQDNLKYISSNEYKADYEKHKAKYTPVAVTSQMLLDRSLRNIRSWNSYTAYARKLWEHYHLVVPVPLIAQAIETAKMTSDKWYKADYKKECIGKSGPANIINYPELQQARKAAGFASKVEYRKDADKAKSHYTMPLDAPDFIRAKSAAEKSDILYKKQKAHTIANFQGYQKLDPSHHPVVQNAEKASQLQSHKNYTEDWDYDKQMIYFPAHITPGYESSAEVKKVQSDAQYKKDHEQNKAKNTFDVTGTQRYEEMKATHSATSDVKYKEGFRKNQGTAMQIPETEEMARSKELYPVLSKQAYSEKSKEAHKNVNVGPDIQEIAHAVDTQKQASTNQYKMDYKQNMVGKPPADPTSAYPEHTLHKKMTQLTSKPEYTKDSEKLLHRHQLPVDAPEFVRAKQVALQASDIEYKKQKQETVDQYRGYQTLDTQDHPVVQRAAQAAQLASEKAYKEDWEYDKQMIYFPAHITPGYESSADVKKVQSDVSYKKAFEKTKARNEFKPTDTERYKEMKQMDNVASDVKYKEEYEKNKGKGSSILETHEMVLSKELRPVQSKKLYTEQSKEMHKNVNVNQDGQEIALAVSSQQLASPGPYRKEYKQKMVGKGPTDPAVAYPEHDLHRKASNLASNADYQKEAAKNMARHQLPVDAPEFIRAKEAAKNASDLEYQKQRNEVIANYRGFQTMDSSEHPIVQHGIKAAELASNTLYTEDWDYDKQMIYFPAHITPGYESNADVKKVQSDVSYKKDFESSKANNQFRPTDTEHYKDMKKNESTSSDVKYKEEYEKNKGKGSSVTETHEMTLSKELRPVQSNKLYTEQSKAMRKNVNVGSDIQEITHAVSAQKLSSDQPYTADYKQQMVGKGRSDPANAYPEVKHHRDVHKFASPAEYQKEAEKMMHHHNLPLDYPEFVRAKTAAKNASDIEYQKQKQETVDKYKGFQTMDSTEHPIVQRGIQVAELQSNALYKEDWEYDKQMIYFPAHITPGYESAMQASKVQSDAIYKKGHNENKAANNFKVTDTDQYKTTKELGDLLSDKKYKEAYEAEKGTNRTQVKETPEMRISKSIAPLLSNKLYGDDARRKMKEYNLDTSMQAISQALAVQKVASTSKYVDHFKKEMVGKAPADIAKSYPEYDHARKVSKYTSKALYWKDAEKLMHTHNLPLDYPEFVRAKQNAKNASDAEYQKQRKEVITNYRGFQTMDSRDHPVVQHGIRVADLISDRKYKEDYMEDRDVIYYPVHLTPGYETAVKSSENQSDVAYKSQYLKEAAKNNYLFTETDEYKSQKGLAESLERYKEDYPREFQALKRTPEMQASDMVRFLLSDAAYTKDAKKRMDIYNVDLQDQRLSHALHASKIGSENKYKHKFNKEMVGKAPNDVTISHPEYDLAKKVSRMASKSEYVKDAEKIKHRHNLPVDYPEFVRARECAKNASDAEYQKQKKQTIEKYRGFQTMDSKDHPVVQHGIRVADLISHSKYIEDYMIDRNIVYYPVHLTPGYEAATKASQFQSELKYKEGYKKGQTDFRFDPTQTDMYKTVKDNQNALNDKAYKEDSKKTLETGFTPSAQTQEMEISNKLKPLAPSEYQKRAKDLLHKYHLNVELPEITHAVCLSQLVSKNKYTSDYNTKIKGAAPSDLANSYPEYLHARNVTKQTSKKEYTKTGDEIRHHFTMPVDTPELTRAKESSKNASDLIYKKQRKEVIDSYKGFQNMDSKDHPIVQQGIKAADLFSERKYKEDYMEDRDLIYFPVHLTAGYDAAVKAGKTQSDTVYKAKHEKEKQANRFNPVQTEGYEAAKQRADTVSDKNYKKALDELPENFTAVDDSIEHQHLKAMKGLMSNKAYTEDAKKTLDKYNINADVIDIAHALMTTPLLSGVAYRKHFNKEVKGKGVSGSGIENYPDHVKAMDNSKLSSKTAYTKDNEKVIHKYTMPVDTPELNRAKESAINASDLEYTKQRKEVIDNYRGFQTMDSKDHPVVQRGIKAADLISERKYKEDYMEDRNLIYYPVHLTPGYEAAVKASQYINGPSYQKAYKRDRNDFRYDVTKTEGYKTQQDVAKLVDHEYKTDPSEHKFTQVSDGQDMERARKVKPLVSYWFYKDQAKKMLDKYHLDAADQHLVHVLHSNQLSSDIKYRQDWIKKIKGKSANENLKSYPGYQHAIKVGKNISQNQYSKEASERMNEYTIPADLPSIKHAKEVDEMVSNNEYTKQRKETIDNFRGFQTMDSKCHPVVQRGIKAADLISERKYKAEYMEDRNVIYYPVHLTAGYEIAVKSSKYASDADYKKWYNKNIRGRGNFPVNVTPGYEQSQQVAPFLSDNAYKKGLGKTMKEFTPVADANEMQHLKIVQPWLSQSKYKKQAKELMGKYHLDVEVPEIAHALFASNMLSTAQYKKAFEKDMKGVGVKNLEKSPYIEQPLKATKILSQAEYTKKAAGDKQLYTLGIETTDIQQALLADKLASDVEYKKGGREALASCQAYYKLNCDEIPRYKKLKDIAANNSDVKYKEEYNDMKKYIYFPYHITPEYESKSDSSKVLSAPFYTKTGRDNMNKQNFKYHEMPGYLMNKELQELMSVHKLQKDKEELQRRGYHLSPNDFHNEHVKEVQKRVSNNVYKAAARQVMDKYNITAELPEIKQALMTSKLVSDNTYKEEHLHEKGTGMKYSPDIPAFKLARDVKSLTSDKLYKDDANQALHQYVVIEDTPHLTHAKAVSQQQSDVVYKRKGKEETGKCRAYQVLRAEEQRDVAHARKVNDIISPAKYREEYNEIRNIIYFPVHLTQGYESALKATKHASPYNYKKNWFKNRYRNNYKVHETEGYQLDREIQKKISHIGYKAEYRKNLGKCPYVTETMERAHHRDMKLLTSDKRYRQNAHEIMDKYHLITDEPRMVNALDTMKLISDNKYKEKYEQEKGKGVSNLLETPQMKQALISTKLTSEVPYKEAALKDLPKVHIPEDATVIKHAQEAGKLVSEITYKKDAKENSLQGYKKISMKDNYTLNRLDKIKDLPSEVHYKRDLYDQKGQSIPVVDTPENVRLQKQQKFQSDSNYKKDLEKFVKGHGLTTDETPQLRHAKDMVSLLSEQKYKEGTKDQHEWKSGEAINTPTAVKAKETTELISDYKYKEKHEKEKGQGCNVITPAISHAQDVGKIVSENAYKEKHKEDSAIPAAFTVLPSTPQIKHVQEAGALISDIKYKEEHNKEDFGCPSELKDSVMMLQNKKTTELQSNIEYKKQAEAEAETLKAYLKCLNETPQALHAKKVREILSDYKYKEAYENEKGIFFFPYFLTPQYETQVKAGKLLSKMHYSKKADKERHNFHLSPDQPNFKQAKAATELISDLKYRQPHQGKGAKFRDVKDVPSIIHSKKMQDLFSATRYRSNYEQIKDRYHLDVTTPHIENAKRAGQVLSDNTYKEKHNKEKGQGFNSYKDSLQMKHLRTLPAQYSDNKYKQDLILSRGKVIQVDDTPWLASHKRAQQFISHIKYGKESGRKLKCRYQPDKINKHVKGVTDNISNSKYHDDYETFFKGNLIPLPETPETRNVLKNSKLLSQTEYQQKAKEGMKTYLVIPDDPEYKRLREAAQYYSDIVYKDEAAKQKSKYTTVPDTPDILKAKESQALQSDNAYKGAAKKKLATEYQLPEEGTATMQQQRFASTLTSDKQYKTRGEDVKHDPTGFKNMKETRETKHAKDVIKPLNELKYKEKAKKGLQKIHPSAEDPWTKKAMETNDNISDVKYKAKDKDLAHKYKLKETDNFMKHALKVRDNISDVKYKENYLDNVGLCWCLPDERVFQHARKVADLSSDNKYKFEAKKLKGKYHITTDTPEFERLRKVQEDISENKYKEGVKDFTVLEITPDIKHATDVSSLVSKNKYKAKFEKSKGSYTVTEKDSAINHAVQVNNMVSQNNYKKKAKNLRKEGYTVLAKRPDTDHQQKVQRNISNIEYRKEARENVDKDFTVIDKRPDVEHAMSTAKMQSSIHYKQKTEAKDIEMLKTPGMKHALGANKLQSDLEYRKEFDKEIKGKGWKFIKDTPAQKHAEEIGKVQSQFKYTKEHRDNIGKGYTAITDRPDIVHATSCKDVLSDYEYKRRHRDMTGKGYTFTPDNPSQMHAEEASQFQSELQYRRKYGNTGKAWQADESPFLGHYKEAQKLVDNIDYRKSAKEINSRGSGAMEDTPASLHYKNAQAILDDRKYKADFEKTVKGRGMTFDLHGTPAMDHIKYAEDIKSQKLYKENYETNVKGRPTVVMDAPQLLNAQKATELISDVKYKQNYNESKGQMLSMVDTPEMRRVRENQKALSQVHYKSGMEEMRGKQTGVVMDTPELRRVRQNTLNFSNIAYKDGTKQRSSVSVLDTPEFRTVKQNSMNFSQIKYQEDRANMRGKVTPVVDDVNMRRVKQATLISSDLAYKGAKGKVQEMEMMRSNAIQQDGIQRPKSQSHKPLPTLASYKAKQQQLRNGTMSDSEMVRSQPVKRWRRNPGSIFNYDPSEYETDAEYEEGKPTYKGKLITEAQSDMDDDYKRMISLEPKGFQRQPTSWQNFVIAKEYKHVPAPSVVPDYSQMQSRPMYYNNVPQAQPRFKAIYDYSAADDDEITFQDGDIIINAQSIDEGWMFGTCLRTGQTGMLPANYVQTVQ